MNGRWLVFTGLIVAPAITQADYRLVLERAKDTRWPAEVSQTTICPVGLVARQCTVAVTTETGLPVGSQIFWAKVGQPIKIFFDSSTHQDRYFVALSDRPATAPAWEPPAAGCLLEVRQLPSGPIETVAQVKTLWHQAKRVQGRGFVSNIFQSVNPFGPSGNLIALFRGAFVAVKDGEYHFATVSDDASVLTVDGRDVASWPGRHGADPCAYGEHSGKIQLSAGTHSLEYFWVQSAESLRAVAAWKLPEAGQYAVIPAKAFAPVGSFSVRDAPVIYFEWKPVAHSIAGDFALVDYRFEVVAAKSNLTYQWSFDDGTTAHGAAVTHTFLRPALRKVRLDSSEANVLQEVDVHLNWEQMQDWSEEHFVEQRRWILDLALNKVPVEDLANASRLAETIHDAELLTALGNASLKRNREFTVEAVEIFFAFGRNFQEPTVRRYEAAEQALRIALSWPSNLRDRIKLRLARLLLDTLGKTDETGQLLDEIQSDNLNDEQRRLLAILRADWVLARGDREGAEAQYAAIGRLGEPDRTRYSVRRQARLESARAFLDRHEYAAAENLVRTVEWEVPAERLAPDFSLLLTKVYIAQQEFPRALLRCQRLLTVTNDDNLRAEVLFYLVEVERALQLAAPAGKSLQQLLTQYPYSEFAARAKERWTAQKD